jgi:L-threonylcarbamoyladenylate synthase
MLTVAGRVESISPSHPDEALLAEAARIVCGGGLVAFPTDTVYGLAANADDPAAIDRLNRVKGRPPDKPYSVHLGDAAQLRPLVPSVPAAAARLMARFWPGPLTIVLSDARGVMTGFRLPDHPVSRGLLRRCACRVVAPSANPSGRPPPTDARAVVAAMDGRFDLLLDAGPTPLRRESTVVRVEGDRVDVLREGAIAAEQVRAVARGA